MKKRLLALLVACAMVVSLLPVQALGNDDADASVQTQAEASEPEAEEVKDQSEAGEEPSEAEQPQEESQPEESTPEASAEDESSATEETAIPEEEPEAAPEAESEAEPDSEAQLTAQDGETLTDKIVRIEASKVYRFNVNRQSEEENYRLDCWPNDDLTVVVRNTQGEEQSFILRDYNWEANHPGENYPENYNEMDAMAEDFAAAVGYKGNVEFGWDSNEPVREDGPRWEPGNHPDGGYVFLRGEADGDELILHYDVHVIDIQSMEVPDFDLPVYSWRTDDGKLDCWPDNLSVTIDEGNGQTRDFAVDPNEENAFDRFRESLDTAYPGVRHDWYWTSDEDPEHPAQAGDDLQCSFRLDGLEDDDKAAHYKVHVTDPSPFADGASVESFSIFESNQDLMREGKDENHNEPWTWKRLNCDPRNENGVTVYLKPTEEGGEPIKVTGNRWEVEQKLREEHHLELDLWWDTDEHPGDNWDHTTHGGTITARLGAHIREQNRDYDIELCTYTVSVLAFPLTITDVTAEDNFTWRNEGDHEDGEEGGEDWYRYPNNPWRVSISGTYEGEPFRWEGNTGEVEDQANMFLAQNGIDARFPIDWNETVDQYDSHWAIDGDYNCQLTVNGENYGYQMHVRDHPIANLTVTPIRRFLSETEPVVEEDGTSWSHVRCWPDEVTITMTNDFRDENDQPRTYTGSPDDARDWLRDTCGFEANFCWESNETRDYQWTANPGEDHGAALFLGDYPRNDQGVPEPVWNIDVTVLDSPIESVTVNVPEGGLPVYETRWRWHYDDDERWKELDCWPHDITVKLSDGEELRGDPGEVREQFVAWATANRPELLPLPDEEHWNWGYESQQHFKDNPWHHKEAQAGDTFSAVYQFLGVESEAYAVQVIPSPIQGLEVNPITRYENDREEEWENGTSWQRLRVEPDTVTVTANSGAEGEADQTKSGEWHEVEDWLRDEYGYGDFGNWDGTRVEWSSDETSGALWSSDGGNNRLYEAGAWVSFGGLGPIRYDVTVVQAPTITDISVEGSNTIYRFVDNREQCEKDDKRFSNVNCEPTHVKLTFNGKEYEADDLYQLRKKIAKDTGIEPDLNWDSDETPVEKDGEYIGSWTLTDGAPHNAWLTFNRVKLDGSDYTVELVDPDAVLSLENVDENTEIKVVETCRFWDERGWDEEGFWRLDCNPGELKIQVTLEGEEPVIIEDGDYDHLNGTLENTLRERYPGIFAWVNQHSNETPKAARETEEPHKGDLVGSWTAGNTYAFKPNDPDVQFAWLDVCGLWQPYKVTVIAEPTLTINSIEGEGNTICRFLTDTYWHDEWNNSYNRIDCWPNNINATLTVDGQNYELNAEDLHDLRDQIQDKLGAQVKLDWDSKELRGENNMGTWRTAVRHDNGAWICLNDHKIEGSEYNVELLDPNDTNLFTVTGLPEKHTITRSEYDRVDQWDDELEDQWWRIRCDPGEVTVSVGEWSLTTSNLGWLRDELENHLRETHPGLRAWLHYENGEKPKAERETDDPNKDKYVGDWTAGNTYDCWLNVCGRDAGHYSVQVESCPIKSVSADPIKIFDTDRYRSWDWDDSQDNSVEWFRLDTYPNMVTVTLTDDTTITGSLDVPEEAPESLESKLKAALPNYTTEDYGMFWGSFERCAENGAFRESEPEWTDGTYKDGAWFRIFGVPTTYDVEVLKNPVVKVEVPTQIVSANDRDNWGCVKCAPSPNDLIKVWLGTEDSEPITGYWRWDENDVPDENNLYKNLRDAVEELGENYKGARFWMRWDTEEDPDHPWECGSHEAYMIVCGKWDNGENKPFSYRVDVHKLQFIGAVKATCTAPGNIAHWLCEECKKYFADQDGKLVERTENEVVEPVDNDAHDWGEPTYTWDGTSKVTATRVCGCDDSHVETEMVDTTSQVTKAATCTAKGETTYTATFTNPAFEQQTKTLENVDVLGHNWGEPTYTWDGTAKVTATRVCSRDASHVETETVNTTSKVTKAATYTAKGETTYTATFQNDAFEQQTKVVANVPTLPRVKNQITASNFVKSYSAKAQTVKLDAKANGGAKLTYKSSIANVKVNAAGSVTLPAGFSGAVSITITSAEKGKYLKATKTITIKVPTVPSVSNPTVGKGQVTVAWKKNTTGTGYQIQVATDKAFKKVAKSVTINKNSILKTTVKGLKAKKTYYIRVRTMHKKNYSKWSGTKTVKVK